MDLNFLTEYFMPIVITACLILGYLIKKSLNFIPNKYIPLFLTLFGAILGCVANASVSLVSVVCGALSGLASTGLHQIFTNIIERKSN